MSQSSHTQTDSDVRLSFGLYGDFAHDADKRAAATALKKRVCSAELSPVVTIPEIVNVLTRLPFSGRLEFACSVLTASPDRDRLIRALYYWCFEPEHHGDSESGRDGGDGKAEADDDFVMLGSGGTEHVNCVSSRYYILRVVVAMLPLCGKVAVELFRAYQQSASTIFCSGFLRALVHLAEHFSDSDLEEVFLSSVEADQKNIVDYCKSQPRRAGFLTRIVKSNHPFSYVPDAVMWATSDAVRDRLFSSDASTVSDFKQNLGYCNWKLHSEVFVSYLVREMKEYREDPVGRGKAFREFESYIKSDIRNVDILALFQICKTYTPVEIDPAAPAAIREYLTALSHGGKLLHSKYEHVLSVQPSLHFTLSRKERFTMLRDNLIVTRCSSSTSGGVVLSPLVSQTCLQFISQYPCHRTLAKDMLDLAFMCFEHLPPFVFWGCLASGSTAPPPMYAATATLLEQEHYEQVATLFLSFRSFVTTATTKHCNKNALSAIEHWIALHEQCLPTTAPNDDHPAGGRLQHEEEHWRMWATSALSLFPAAIVSMVKKSVAVLPACSAVSQRSPITSYVPAITLLVRHQGRVLDVVLQAANDHMAAASTFSKPLGDSAFVNVDHVLRTVCAQLKAVAPVFQTSLAPYSSSTTSGVDETPLLARAVEVIDDLSVALEQAASNALTEIRASLVFDPTQVQLYVSAERQRQLGPLLTSELLAPGHLCHMPDLQKKALSFCVDLINRAAVAPQLSTLGFVEVQSQGVHGEVLVSFNKCAFEVHSQYKRMAVNLLLQLRRACVTAASMVPPIQSADGVAREAWAVYKQQIYGDSIPALGRPGRPQSLLISYLKDCAPVKLLSARERADLDALALAVISAQETPATPGSDETADNTASISFDLVRRLATLGVLNDGLKALLAVERDSKRSMSVRVELLLKEYGDVSDTAVRELLQCATNERDASDRMVALLVLLDRSRSSGGENSARLREVARSLSYAESRIKNEAGRDRPQIYDWITTNAASIVQLSLTLPQTSEAELLADVTTISKVLVQMLRADMSKRDSVAKAKFQALGGTLVRAALSDETICLMTQIRQAWVMCGIELHWMVMTAYSGDVVWKSYIWPLEKARKSYKQTVDERILEEIIKPFLITNFKAGETIYTRLRAKVFSSSMHVHAPVAAFFTAAHAINLLIDSLMAVQQSWLGDKGAEQREWLGRSTLFLIDNHFFDEGASSTTFVRASALLRYTGALWVEVPLLVNFVESVVAGVAENHEGHPLYPNHFHLAVKMFRLLLSFYSSKSLWYEVPLMAKTITSLFHTALRLRRPEESASLLPSWRELKNANYTVSLAINVGVTSSSYRTSLQSITQFLATHVPHLRNASLDTSGAMQRRLSTIRELLDLTRSAFHLFWNDLASLRDDVLQEYIGKTYADAQGVFDPYYSRDGGPSANERLPMYTSSFLFNSFNGPVMSECTAQFYAQAMTISAPLAARSDAVTKFVVSPASGHRAIIELLQRLNESRKKNEKRAEKTVSDDKTKAVVDDGADVLIESIVLNVFKIDAAWFVLSYLLSPSVIASAPHRITASILQNLKTWVPVAKVVSVLRILLEPKRRFALSIFLHKSLLRVLFDCATHNASALLLAEWSDRERLKLHVDVQHDMVRLCVQCIAQEASAGKQSEIAWQIVEEVATDANVHSETQLLLLLPTWTPTLPFVSGPFSSVDGVRMIAGVLDFQPPDSAPLRRQDPTSFSWLLDKLCSESSLCFTSSDACPRLRRLARMLSAQSANRHIRVLAMMKQYTFSGCMVGEADDEAVDDLHTLVLSLLGTYPVEVESGSLPLLSSILIDTSRSTSSQASVPKLLSDLPDHIENYLLEVACQLYTILVLQVCFKHLAAYTHHQRTTQFAHIQVASNHAYVAGLRAALSRALDVLTHTAPAATKPRARALRLARHLVSESRLSGWWPSVFGQVFDERIEFLNGVCTSITQSLQ